MKHDLSENFSKKYKNSLSVWNKLGYGMGEAGSQFIWSLISSYLTLYYTDVVGLLPAGISFIMLIARIWDAVNDPMFVQLQRIQIVKWTLSTVYFIWCSNFGSFELSDIFES